jgi:hypothetical protein
MFLMAEVTYFQDRRDSSKRVTTLDENQYGSRWFLLNPNRFVNIKVDGTGSSFLFSDNHRDRRENLSFIKCTSTVDELQTIHDTEFASKFLTLPIYPKNDPARIPVDTMIDVDDIAYFDAYNPDPDNYCWMIYNYKAFKRVEVLVGYNLDQVEDVAETGTTTTTSTTTTSSETTERN